MSQTKTEEAIFCEALELPAVERAAFLKSACDGDAQLFAAVQGLLQLHDTEEDFLVTPAIAIAADGFDEKPGDRIGCYRLDHKIGEGGFGVVWRAQQLEPIQRRVALKIVKLGMDSETIVSRFDDERQTLALMNHPHIATVLDAGVTDNGRPFFAMELVDGTSIDQFFAREELSRIQQMEIFVTVCRAVHHAHQKGVVHRDIKPTNILIATSDDQVVPKVIDFGIATAIQPKEAGEVRDDRNVTLMGTPQYMSPEQWHRDADIDTRSDIYSLGVVLYRLMTGEVPDTQHHFDDQAQPQSREERNVKPVAIPGLDEDLGWIIDKAMRFEREERYQSASELALDIERYIHGQAVVAHPGGLFYQLKKFTKRNKLVVGFGMMAVAALFLGICATTWGMIYANQQEEIARGQTRLARENEEEAIRLKKIAEAEARKLRVIANVMKNMLPEANPFRGMKSGFQIREHLDQLINSVDSLTSEPELEADLRITAARIYENISRPGRARLQYSKAREIRAQELGENHAKTLFCLVGMASSNIELGRLEAAERMVKDVLERGQEDTPRVYMAALRTLRKIRHEQDRDDEAFEIAEQCVAFAEQAYGRDVFGLIHVSNEYAMSAMKIGLIEDAEKVVRESLLVLERDHPERKFVIANTKHRLAEILMQAEQYDEAKLMAESFIAIQRQTLGENDIYVMRGLILLSEIHRRADDLLTAEQIALEAVERTETLPEDEISIRMKVYRQLARILNKLDLARAAEAWESAIQFGWQFQGGHSSVGKDLLKQALVFEKLEKFEDAADRLKRSIDIFLDRQESKGRLIEAYQAYSRILHQLGQTELAESYSEKANDLEGS